MLFVVGQDDDNGFYPIAIAIVQSESKDTWSWFLTRLLEDLIDFIDKRFSFISDQQKV